MANISLKDIQFPGLNNVYKVPEVDSTLTQSGAAADAKKTGDELSDLKQDLSQKVGYGSGTNLFDVSNTTNICNGCYINYQSGNKSANDAYSAFIVAIDSEKGSLSLNEPYAHVAFATEYTDLNDLPVNTHVNGYVSGVVGSNGWLENITIPSTAKYVIVSISTSYLPSTQLQYGAMCTPREAYVSGIDGYELLDKSVTVDSLSFGSALFDKTTVSGSLVAISGDTDKLITGVSPMPEKLVVNGVNLWNEQWEKGTYGVTTGGFNTSDNSICSLHTSPIPIQPSTEYYITSLWNTAVLFYDDDDTYIGYQITNPYTPTFTSPENAYLLRFYCVSNYGDTYNNDLIVTLNSYPDKSYRPYVGTIISDFEEYQLSREQHFVYAYGASTSLSVDVASLKGSADKKPYESGYIHFTVPVNQYIVDESVTTDTTKDNENTIVDVDCILSLPTSYTQIGKPTKLVMMCHGAGRGVYGASTAFDQNGDWRQITEYNKLVSALVSNGYAVFDCNGYSNTNLGCSFWGVQRGIEAWRKAYDYIVKNYNVEENISIYGFSMGGLTALNLAFQAFPNVKCVAVGSPVTNLDETTYQHAGSTAFNAAWGISAYDASVFLGNNPIANVMAIDNTDYCFKTIAPLKIWFGGTETWPAPSDAQKIVTAIKNAGGKAEFRSVDGRGHEICYGGDTAVINEIVMYFNRYND